MADERQDRSATSGAERRGAHRHPFVALAELTRAETNERIAAQTTQLSSSGCYLGAVNPFPEGTPVRIRLVKGGEIFESAARVLHVHAEFGMGVIFENVSEEQQRVLDSWLAQSHNDSR